MYFSESVKESKIIPGSRGPGRKKDLQTETDETEIMAQQHHQFKRRTDRQTESQRVGCPGLPRKWSLSHPESWLDLLPCLVAEGHTCILETNSLLCPKKVDADFHSCHPMILDWYNEASEGIQSRKFDYLQFNK